MHRGVGEVMHREGRVLAANRPQQQPLGLQSRGQRRRGRVFHLYAAGGGLSPFLVAATVDATLERVEEVRRMLAPELNRAFEGPPP